MPSIAYNKFAGSTPRMADHLVSLGYAAEALDCKFYHGTLQSWREPKLVLQLEEGVTSVHRLGCCWVQSDKCVDMAEGGPNCREVFRTGEKEYPEIGIVDYDECTIAWHRLGVPCAQDAPYIEIMPYDGPDKDYEGRSYVYQYVNALGQRGAASAASDSLLIRDGNPVMVTGWPVPDPSWEITSVRIYRSVSGMTGLNEDTNKLDTTYMLVAEIPIDQPAYIDNMFNEWLAEALVEDEAPPPPDGLRGIIQIGTTNTLAGYVGNSVYFSSNNEWHSWPHHFDLDDNVCGLVESNGNVYVATDGAPYVIGGKANCEQANCREIVKLPGKYPMVGCGNRRMAALPQGAVYAAHEGLIALNGTSAPIILTHGLYAPDDWAKLIPASITPVLNGGKLFVFGYGGSFYMQLASGAERGWQLDSHSNLSDRAIDAFETRTGEFYIVKEGGLYQWDRGTQLRPHKWLSPQTFVNTMTTFGAARMVMRNGPESVKIVGDEREILSRSVLRDKVFRLPMWGACSWVQIELTGTAEVSLFALATSMQELTS